VAVHATAGGYAETDWSRIVRLYDRLITVVPSPVVAMNRAIAVAEAEGAAGGPGAPGRAAAAGSLDDYHYLHAARADLTRLDRREEAAAAYRRALDLATSPADRAFLQRRLAASAH